MPFALPVGRLRRIRQLLRDERNLLDVLLDSVDVAVVACDADGANPVEDGNGRRLGAVVVFADVTEQRIREARIREQLHDVGLAVEVQEAIEAGRLLLYAQPIVELASGQTVQEELLLRMRAAEGVENPTTLAVLRSLGSTSSRDSTSAGRRRSSWARSDRARAGTSRPRPAVRACAHRASPLRCGRGCVPCQQRS